MDIPLCDWCHEMRCTICCLTKHADGSVTFDENKPDAYVVLRNKMLMFLLDDDTTIDVHLFSCDCSDNETARKRIRLYMNELSKHAIENALVDTPTWTLYSHFEIDEEAIAEQMCGVPNPEVHILEN